MTRIEGGTDGEITIPVGATAANRMYRNSCRIARDSRLRSCLAPSSRSIIFVSSLWRDISWRAGSRWKEKRRGELDRDSVLPTRWFRLRETKGGNVPRPNLVNDNSAIPVFPWNRACNLDFLGERLSSDVSIDTYAWQGRTNGPRVKPWN